MKKTISRYIERNIGYPKWIEVAPSDDLQIIVIIPCHDEPDILPTLRSLSCCDDPGCDVEIIVSINAGISDSEQVKERNRATAQIIRDYSRRLPSWQKIHVIENNNLPKKKAGVGLARKIGMDEAVRRYVALEKEDGILVCFDADSQCRSNYFVEIIRYFQSTNFESASIHYEHPVQGVDFSQAIYDSIIQYELHLRYFIHMQKQLGLPFAFHTVGSSMACTCSAYCAVGGMNQRKAGEDFYFIHKLVKYGRHSELNSTTVIPSPRISDRVPFGTGKAVGEMQDSARQVYLTYHPDSFEELRVLVSKISKIYSAKSLEVGLPDGLTQFLKLINGKVELDRIVKNTSDFGSFYLKFWHWFDAFVLMKYLHYMRDSFHPNLPVFTAVNMVEDQTFATPIAALKYYRERDKNR